MASYWIIRGAEELDMRLDLLKAHLLEKQVWPLRLDMKKFVAKRTLPQNALFWMWCEQIAHHLTKGGRPTTKDQMHDLLCHRFLGYETTEVMGEPITKLRGTSKLDKGEFQHFMEKVDAWAVYIGCQLKYPAASEYANYKEAQEQ